VSAAPCSHEEDRGKEASAGGGEDGLGRLLRFKPRYWVLHLYTSFLPTFFGAAVRCLAAHGETACTEVVRDGVIGGTEHRMTERGKLNNVAAEGGSKAA